jgi:hypothetical protein
MMVGSRRAHSEVKCFLVVGEVLLQGQSVGGLGGSQCIRHFTSRCRTFDVAGTVSIGSMVRGVGGGLAR